jgi:hypothetical protein
MLEFVESFERVSPEMGPENCIPFRQVTRRVHSYTFGLLQ